MYFFSRSRSEKSESYYTKTHKLHLKYIHFSASPCHETSYLDLLCSLLPGLPASGLGPAHCILHTQHSVGSSGRACPETLWFPSAVGIKLRLLITAPSYPWSRACLPANLGTTLQWYGLLSAPQHIQLLPVEEPFVDIVPLDIGIELGLIKLREYINLIY